MTNNQKELISYHQNKLYNALDCFKVFLQSNDNYKLAKFIQNTEIFLNEFMNIYAKNDSINEDEWILKFKNFCKDIIKEK